MIRSELGRLIGNPALVIGLFGFVTLLAMAVIGVQLAPYDPNAGASVMFRYLPDGNYTFKVPPTLPDDVNWFGTDQLGRDLFSRVLAGARLTLTVVLMATVVRLGIGLGLGLISGWYGGALIRITSVAASGVAAIPQLVLAVLLVLVLREYGPFGFIAALALVGWPEIAEFTRAEAQRVKASPFMEAASATGARGGRLIRNHLLPALGPQLLTVAALETGAVLLLLAELGLLGIFLAGSTILVGEYGPVGFVAERAPEWGQMLGTIQVFAMTESLSTLIPALFIVLACAVLAMLAEGLRAASDPFGTHRLSPRAFKGLTRALAGALCFSAVGLFTISVPRGPLTMDEGLKLATTTAQRVWPGSVAVAGVARHESLTDDRTQPDRLTYYFRNRYSEVLRISYQNADRLAVEVRQYEMEDELDYRNLRPLDGTLVSYDVPIAEAEAAGGADFREHEGARRVRAIVTWPRDRPAPIYEVRYGDPRGKQRDLCCWPATVPLD